MQDSLSIREVGSSLGLSVGTLLLAAIVVACVRGGSIILTLVSNRVRLSTAPSQRQRVVYDRSVRTTQSTERSGVFKTLPPEIRVQIYQHAIGNRLLHLVEGDSGIGRAKCYFQDYVEAWYHPCWKAAAYQAAGRRKDSLLSLLLTCRHVYSEAIEVLYTSSTFHFLRPSDLVSFVDSIPRLQASHIRSIKLYVNPTSTGTDMAYVAIWPILSSLPTLKELRLLIAPSVMTKEVWKQHEGQLLEPIKTFSPHLKIFHVFLSVFPDWIEDRYAFACYIRPIKDMKQLSGAHLSRYS